jgi:hypothetical protein
MRSLPARTAYGLAVLIIILLAAAGIIAGLGVTMTVLFGLILLGFVSVWAFIAQRAGSRGGPEHRRAAMADENSAFPATPFIEDDATPLGATSEQHEEISPHDLPPGHPGRAAAAAQAAESEARGGRPLTRGDVQDRPEAVRDEGLRRDRGGEQDEESRRRFARGDVAWTAEEQGRGEVRGPRSSQ